MASFLPSAARVFFVVASRRVPLLPRHFQATRKIRRGQNETCCDIMRGRRVRLHYVWGAMTWVYVNGTSVAVSGLMRAFHPPRASVRSTFVPHRTSLSFRLGSRRINMKANKSNPGTIMGPAIYRITGNVKF